jgi:hypothetical protein
MELRFASARTSDGASFLGSVVLGRSSLNVTAKSRAIGSDFAVPRPGDVSKTEAEHKQRLRAWPSCEEAMGGSFLYITIMNEPAQAP